MTTLAELLAVIIAHPQDGLVRLAYADLLEETGQDGDGRAKYIRATNGLLEHEQIWPPYGPTPAWPDYPSVLCGYHLPTDALDAGVYWWWDRGFVHHVAMPLQLWLEHGPILVRSHPLEQVTITDRAPGRASGLAGWRWYSNRWYDWKYREDHPDVLPADLFDAVHAGRVSGDYLWPSEEVALSALSAGCIRLATGKNDQSG